ncbi:internal head protein [Escherichia coli O26:H11 str. CVM10026]|nr:internal head protein [Escherichia coli O26:H11 str. CVM10026]
MTGGHSRALTDRLASIKNRMHMDGEATLSNGASMKQFIGDGEGYIQLTDPDGSVYMIKAKSIQGVDMADAIGKLLKPIKRVMYRNTWSNQKNINRKTSNLNQRRIPVALRLNQKSL